MFSVYRISPSATTILETKNIVTISYTNLTVEPSIFHKHNETEILFPAGGEGTLLTQYNSIPFVPQHLYIVNPQTSHTEKAKTTLQYYVVKMQNVFLPNCINHFSDIPLSQEEYSILADLLSNTIAELKSNAPYSDKTAYLYLANFYYHVKRILSKQDQELTKKKNKLAASELVSEVKKYISENYGLALKIGKIAKHFAVSQNNLTLLFRQETGKTPQQFLLDTRIEAGKYLLTTSDYNITHIAFLCGFNSPAHFAEMFKKSESISPTNYRAQRK